MFFVAFAAAASSLAAPPAPVQVPPPVIAVPIAPKPFDKAKWDAQTKAANACRRAFMGQDYYPQPAIWRIADADTKLFLMGTYHMLPTSFDWRTPQLDQIVREAQSLTTEDGLATRSSDFPGLIAAFERGGSKGPKAQPLAERLNGENRAKWIGMEAMMPEKVADQINRAPTWLAAMSIAATAGRFLQPTMGSGVEDQLRSEFVKAGKPIEAMEDWKSVFASLNEIPPSVQRQMLNSALDEIGHRPTLEQRMASFHTWAKGDLNVAPPESFPEELLDRLVHQRNRAWVNVIKQKMRRPGTALIAVGAGHLRGQGSLIQLLADQGIRAELVSPTGEPHPRPKFRPAPKNWQECTAYQFGRTTPQAGVD